MLSSLSQPLRERARLHPLAPDAPHAGGEFVLYWMRTAARGHDNPALDTAIELGRACGLPVFVYHALSERYDYASDRLHTFALEGARDVQSELAERGIGYAFHLERPGSRGAWLHELSQRAALVVTEDMPVRPLDAWTARIAARSPGIVCLVDTACVVPMQRVGQAHERALTFRRSVEQHWRAALADPWVDAPCAGDPFVPELPFEPVDLAAADLAELVASCDIDHQIPPVPGTPGGSRAGYARWAAFVDSGIRSYHRTRNDPLRDGTSRMSAHLHFGHVSPLRLAREADAVGGPGAEKFLDELLVWRELAHAFCFFRPEHDTTAALPEWARDTLRACEGDPRPALPSWETLARGATGDALWDAAQRSLLIHGELHNNVRMTWGKALLQWTPTAARALQLAIDLNHRYALDGRDPASYGGIVWCLGAFDRPVPPAQPITGTVRTRPTSSHASRLDVGRYAARTGRPAAAQPPRVAVVGAGMSGLACARTLTDQGLDVVVLDKARGAGGRMSTRRGDGVAFDHGAQYFTARDPRFVRHVESWVHDGVAAEWDGVIAGLRDGVITRRENDTRRFVGVPGMSAIARHLAAACELRTSFRVAQIAVEGGRLHLSGDDGDRADGFDFVVLAMPAPQAADVSAHLAPDIAAAARRVRFSACWAVMAEFDRRVGTELDGAFVDGPELSWIARNSSKPSRPDRECWTLHAAPDWSDAHLEDDPDSIARELCAAFERALAIPVPDPVRATAHRWRFALPTEPLADACLFDSDARIGACGDWCAGPRVEGAFLSGAALAGRILGHAATRPAPRQRTLF